jgi:L-fuculose-phosphate aldolase
MTQTNSKISELVGICHRLYAKGFVAATDGNVSARLENGNILTTRTGISKGLVTPGDIIEVDPQGKPIDSLLRPSTEVGMHVYIYSQRPDIHAITHAHPPYATGFATAGLALDKCVAPEVIVGLGAIPLAHYATPATPEVASSLAPFVKNADAILLANHGVVTYGKDLQEAYFKMEKVEHTAQVSFVARMLGGEKVLSSAEIGKLLTVSREAYGKDFSEKPACATGNEPESKVPGDEELRTIVRQMIRPST